MAQLIANRYQIDAEIGAGGMGTVYRATDTRSGETVALKQIKPDLIQDDLLERFRREGQALRDLDHPNIVKMLDSVEVQGQHYLIMEYVSGGDLKQIIEKGRMPIERILKIAIDLADALTRAHKLDIIHRDLKPANILIAQDGTLRLTDFGVAVIGREDSETQQKGITGTIDYMPPEVFQNGYLDNRADIWAFGIVLFEMLIGRRPFVGKNLSAVIYQIVSDKVPDLEELRPDTPLDLIDLVYRMLEKDPIARIPSVRHIGAELEDILRGRHTSRHGTNRFEKPLPDVYQRPKHNLPQQTTAFVGREGELEELTKIILDPNVRLITIVAPGGMGKSRLSLELGERLLNANQYEDGVFLVELAALSDAENIVPTLAEAINFQFKQNREQKEQLLEFLAKKEMLLIIDNWEHLLDGANLLIDLLKAAPHVQVLATSRERLKITGEQLFTLAGLEYPEWESPEAALNFAAVKLFMNSAIRAKPSFELLTGGLSYLAQICQMLAGMPLAIVLAAAWVESLSIQEIAEELAESIDLLESDMRDIPERQRSIQAVFDYAWNRLSEEEQTIFMKLTVFRGGFARKAGQALADASLKQLTSLVNQSLLRRDHHTGRYFVHELLRQFGGKLLDESPIAEEVRDAHSQLYLEHVAELEARIKGHGQVEALNDIEVDFENIRAAWEWSIAEKHFERIHAASEALTWFSYMRTREIEGRNLFSLVLDKLSPHGDYPLVWADITLKMEFLQANDVLAMNDNLAMALEIAQELQQAASIAFTWLIYARIECVRTRDFRKAVSYFEQALDYYQAENDKFYIGWTLHRLGYCYPYLGDVATCLALTEDSLIVRREIGDLSGISWCLSNLGTGYLVKDNYESAVATYNEAIVTAKKINQPSVIAFPLAMLGWSHFLAGEFGQAQEAANTVEALSKEFHTGEPLGIAQLIQGLRACILLNDYHQGANLCRSGLDIIAKSNPNIQFFGYSSLMIALCGLGAFEEVNEHLTKNVDFRIVVDWVSDTGMVCAAKTIFLADAGQFENAAIGLGFVLASGYTTLNWARDWHLLVELKETLLSELGEENFRIAWETGCKFSIAEAVAFAQEGLS